MPLILEDLGNQRAHEAKWNCKNPFSQAISSEVQVVLTSAWATLGSLPKDSKKRLWDALPLADQ